MTNPTSNFGWQMPTSTDLVTDLPADFETFGQAVDTSMADLKGGTTGQILSKATNTDMDFVWITNDVGDITAVTAGTGISGGGTSGAVTITNSMATEIAAAGDLIVGTGAATFDNLPIGTTGQVLTADTTVSPYKVKWATPASTTPTFVGCAVVSTSASQTITNATWTAITWNSERYDTDGFHDNATNNSRLTVPTGKGGKYLLSGTIDWDNNASSSKRYLMIRKNNVEYLATIVTPNASEPSQSISTIMNLAAGDYVELFAWQNSTASRLIYTLEPNGDFSLGYLGA